MADITTMAGRKVWRAGTAPSGLRLFWLIYDVATAFLAIAVSADILNRFGIASLVWLLVYALVSVRIALVWRSAFHVAVRNWPYFVYPAVCMCSVLWSTNPAWTLQASIQMTMTVVIALFIGWRFPLLMICMLQIAGLFVGIALSLLNWVTGMFGALYAPSGGLLGVFTQKNMLGQRALFMTLSGAAFVTLPAAAGLILQRIAVVAMMLVALLMLALSQSATSILLTPVFVGLLLLLIGHRIPRPLVLAAIATAVVVLALAPLTFAISGVNPVLALLDAFGKSPDLTGRTDLWALGSAAIADDWLLGVGYGAFWTSPVFANLHFLARDHGEMVTSFHNFVLEIWIACGIPGLLAMALLIGTTVWRTFALWWITRATMAAYALAGTLTCIPLALMGTGLYRQHEYTIMFVIMVGVAAQCELRRIGRGPALRR